MKIIYIYIYITYIFLRAPFHQTPWSGLMKRIKQITPGQYFIKNLTVWQYRVL